MTTVPHLALPFSWSPNGHAAEVEQDSQPDIAACVAALMLCPMGWRAELVEYGLPEQTFLLDLESEEIASAIARWEPRAAFALDEPADSDLLLRRLRVLLEVSE